MTSPQPLLAVPFTVTSSWAWSGTALVRDLHHPRTGCAQDPRAVASGRRGRDLVRPLPALTDLRLDPDDMPHRVHPLTRPLSAYTAKNAAANLAPRLDDAEFCTDLDLLVNTWPDGYDVPRRPPTSSSTDALPALTCGAETRCAGVELGLLVVRPGWDDLVDGIASRGILIAPSSGRRTGAAGPFGRGEGRRDPRSAPSTRGAATAGGAAPVDVAGPGDHRGPRATTATGPTTRHARHTGDDPGLASTSDRSAVDHRGDPATGSPLDPARSAGTGETPGLGEPRLGLPAHPRGVGRARPPGGSLHGLGHPQGPGPRSPRRSGPTWQQFLTAQVRGHRGVRPVPCRHHPAAPAQRVLHRRACHPPGAHPRRDRPPHRPVAGTSRPAT